MGKFNVKIINIHEQSWTFMILYPIPLLHTVDVPTLLGLSMRFWSLKYMHFNIYTWAYIYTFFLFFYPIYMNKYSMWHNVVLKLEQLNRICDSRLQYERSVLSAFIFLYPFYLSSLLFHALWMFFLYASNVTIGNVNHDNNFTSILYILILEHWVGWNLLW